MRAFRLARQGRVAENFAVWIFRVARNLALDHLRRGKVQERALDGVASAWEGPTSPRHLSRTPERQLESVEFGRELERALRSLPEDMRSVFLLREREGLSYGQIAEVIGVPSKTVSTRLHRARAKLRGELAPYLGRPAEQEIRP